MNAALKPESPEVELELPAAPTSVRLARDAVTELARDVGAPADDIRLAVSEAVGNAVTHAFREDRDGTIRVLAERRRNTLVVVVKDDGGGMRANSRSKGLGLGIPLITNLAAHTNFDSSERGTTVSMTFPTAPAETAG